MKVLFKKMIAYMLLCICIVQICAPMCTPIRVYADDDSDVCAISIAVDISGSMKSTDPDRITFELIKLFIDVCGEDDYLSVTAYNDKIIYNSGMVDMGDEALKEQLKQEIDSIEFSGNTDNGLGMLTATNEILKLDKDYKEAFVLMISDGDTYLVGSDTNRTVVDSDNDMNYCSKLALDNNITLNVIEYTSTFMQDTNIMSVVTAATGGGTNITDNPKQFIQIMLGTFFAEYRNSKIDLQIADTQDLLNRSQFAVSTGENQKGHAIIFSTESINDFEVLKSSYAAQYHLGKNYVVIDVQESSNEELSTIYSFSENACVATGMVVTTMDKKEEVIIPEPVEVVTHKPVGTDYQDKRYTEKTELSFDVSQLFKDEDNDIVEYYLKDTTNASLSGTMLSVSLADAGELVCDIVARDSHGNEGQAQFKLELIPAWEQYRGVFIALIVLLIIAITVVVCVVIVKKIVFSQGKHQIAIKGILDARFLDLKSRNEVNNIQWNLAEYSPEGVTLLELFKSRSIIEDLNDLDKIVFYPSDKEYELILVHAMVGGIFINETLVHANSPAKVRIGDTIYVSFAENASEMAIYYRRKQ